MRLYFWGFPRTRKTWGCEIYGYQYTLWRAFVLLSEASGVLVENDSGNEEHVLQSKAQYVSKKQTSFSADSDKENGWNMKTKKYKRRANRKD
jgi:hypothetical protein